MRKFLIKSLLFILIIMTLILLISGIGYGNFGIKSFLKLEQETSNLYSEVYKLQEKNTIEYESKKELLINSAKIYNQKKSEYNSLIPIIYGVGNNMFDLYEIDFLWTIIGNYATEEGIILQFDISKTLNDSVFENTDYILCNLNFTISGEYSSIVDFIYDLENDERLGFEIRNFELKKFEENLQAKFVVNSTPINKTNLSIAVGKDIIYKE